MANEKIQRHGESNRLDALIQNVLYGDVLRLPGIGYVRSRENEGSYTNVPRYTTSFDWWANSKFEKMVKGSGYNYQMFRPDRSIIRGADMDYSESVHVVWTQDGREIWEDDFDGSFIATTKFVAYCILALMINGVDPAVDDIPLTSIDSPELDSWRFLDYKESIIREVVAEKKRKELGIVSMESSGIHQDGLVTTVNINMPLSVMFMTMLAEKVFVANVDDVQISFDISTLDVSTTFFQLDMNHYPFTLFGNGTSKNVITLDGYFAYLIFGSIDLDYSKAVIAFDNYRVEDGCLVARASVSGVTKNV